MMRISQPRVDTDTKPLHPAFSDKTYIMGVLNITPDSFSDGGLYLDKEKAVEYALDMVRDGADIIDVGGESARPFAKDISVEEELNRVLPVIEAIRKKISTPVSIDTRKSLVAERSLKAGVKIVNDVSGLKNDPDMAPIVAKYNAELIIMHTKGTPQDMQIDPTYKNLIEEIIKSLRESLNIARRAGVDKDKIIIDPGIGFGKRLKHNLEILNRLDEFKGLGQPICVGTSRKSFIGKVLGLPNLEDRLAGTIATCVVAIMKGANILRVHDVKEVAKAARITDSILRAG